MYTDPSLHALSSLFFNEANRVVKCRLLEVIQELGAPPSYINVRYPKIPVKFSSMQAWWRQRYGSYEDRYRHHMATYSDSVYDGIDRSPGSSHGLDQPHPDEIYNSYAQLVAANPYEALDSESIRAKPLEAPFKGSGQRVPSHDYLTHKKLRDHQLRSQDSIVDFFCELKRQYTIDTVRRRQTCSKRGSVQSEGRKLCGVCCRSMKPGEDKYHKKCIVCYECGKPCWNSFHEREIEVPMRFDIEDLLEDDEDDPIDTTAPLRLHRSRSMKSSVLSSSDSRLSSVFDQPLSPKTSVDSVPSSPKDLLKSPAPKPTETKQVILCDQHYHPAPNCFLCDKPVGGPKVDLPDGSVHLEHITCSLCNLAYEKKRHFFYKSGFFYCQKHYSEQYETMVCHLCGKDLNGCKDMKMVRKYNDPRVAFYDAECYKRTLFD